jgi:hypothetical protein
MPFWVRLLHWLCAASRHLQEARTDYEHGCFDLLFLILALIFLWLYTTRTSRSKCGGSKPGLGLLRTSHARLNWTNIPVQSYRNSINEKMDHVISHDVEIDYGNIA